MKAVILVPRRAEPARDKLWSLARERWERHFELPIIEGHHDEGPFNRSAAVNLAARSAGDWDYAVVIDADILIARRQVDLALALAADSGKVTWAHRRWRGFHEDWTRRLVADRRDLGRDLDRDDMDIYVERTNPISWSCCIVFPRAVFDDLGGFDERFRGWGFEDMALQSAIVGLYGHERIEGDVYHLWHARTTDGSGRAAKAGSGYTADAITNARLGRRYMVALRRDHGLHDRPGLPSDDTERERDIANLLRDDAKLDNEAIRLGLPDWSKWWPSLPELVEGARRQNAENRSGTVTVVVHSGGSPAAWPDRREYLRASLASLTERVKGPIVKRVVYDCWGDPTIRQEIQSLAEPLGYYVVGPDMPVDYTGSMQAMWRYLAKQRAEFVFQAEDDFTYDREVDLAPMIEVLRSDPGLVQMALLRDACYQDERDSEPIGNILGWPRPAFTFRDGWFEHRQFFTANPSLFRRSLTATPWPSGKHSETIYGQRVLADPRRRAAFWGNGEQWITHVGQVRAGVGY